jgi:hypothetical protein
MDLIQYIGSIGGIAGVLAFFIFLTYRYLVAQMRQDRKYMEDRLTGIIKDYNEDAHSRTDAMVKNTQILTELIIWLKARNGHN